MKTLAVLGVLAIASAAYAQQSVSIDLTGLKLKDKLNQSKSSSPNALAPATRYTYDVDGMVKGDAGLLKVLYPNPVPLSELLESFQPGASALLHGYACNPSGSHPAVFMDERFEGTTDIGGIEATFAVTVTAGIDASNFTYFSLTDVVIDPAFLIGSAVFTSGTAKVARIGCPADCDGSGELDIDDFICYQTLFGLGDPGADMNCDLVLDVDDFIEFQTAFGVGCG